MEIDGLIIHENYIAYNRVNIRKEQNEAYKVLFKVCEEIEKAESSGINIDKWYSLERILINLGIKYTKN